MKNAITHEQFANHDCKGSEDSGCQTCTQWFEQWHQENASLAEIRTLISQIGVIDEASWYKAYQNGEPVKTLLRRLQEMRKVALECLYLGYYTTEEYSKWCKVNGLLIF